MMTTICAWCNKQISNDSGQQDGLISHGICRECQDYFFPSHGQRSFTEFLDLLSVPIVVIDDEMRLVTANRKACRLLGKKARQMEGLHFGEAVECPYARLPGGCGKAVHCRSCTIRLTTLDTYTTGQSHYDVPAFQDISFAGEKKKICFLISTETSGEFVLLRIHEITDDRSKQEEFQKRYNKQLRSI
jgi:PAS domain-containing protein